MQNEELDLAEYTGALRRAFPAMTAAGVVFALLAVLATWLMKPAWEAEASLLMATKEEVPTLEALVGQQEGNPLSILKGIVRSRTALDRIARDQGIDRKELEEALEVETQNDANQLILRVRWKAGRDKAPAIVRSAIGVLESMRKEIGFSVASRQAKLLRQAITEKTVELDAAEAKVKEYQKGMKSLIDPTNPSSVLELLRTEKQLEQDLGALRLRIREARQRAAKVAGASVELPSGLPNAQDWQRKLSRAEYDLQIARVKDGEDSPNVVRLRKELQVTRAQLQKEIENYFRSVESNVDADVAKLEAERIVMEWRLESVRIMAKSAPQEGQELARLLREVSTLTTVLSNLRQQYELKQIDEVGDVSWSVLEEPHLTEDEPINKKFGRNGIVGFVVGALLVGALRMLGQRRRSFAQGG